MPTKFALQAKKLSRHCSSFRFEDTPYGHPTHLRTPLFGRAGARFFGLRPQNDKGGADKGGADKGRPYGCLRKLFIQAIIVKNTLGVTIYE